MRLFVLAAVAALALTVPSSAAAATCGVASASAVFEREGVQVYKRKRSRRVTELVACLRSSGQRRVVATSVSDPAENIASSVEDLVDGHYLWTSASFTYAESFDVLEHTLIDLETGRKVVVTTGGDDGPADVLAVSGALVVADGTKLELRRIGGARETLATGAASAPAWAAGTLYFRLGAEARSLPLARGQVRLGTAFPRNRRTARCAPRRARTVARHFGMVVSQEASGTVSVCRLANRRRIALGSAELLGFPDGYRRVFVRRGDAYSIVDAVSGRVVRELVLPGAVTAVAGDDTIAAHDGSVLMLADASGLRELDRGQVNAPAISNRSSLGSERRHLYWISGGTATRALELGS